MEAVNQEIDENPVSPIDLSIFKDQIELNLLNILELMPKQEKSLILEKSCISKLNFFTRLEPLKERQVKGNISILKETYPLVQTPILVYITPPKKEILEIIQSHIRENHYKSTAANPPSSSSKKKELFLLNFIYYNYFSFN